MIGTTDHEWKKVKARTPSGKVRIVLRCEDCGLITYSSGRLTAWKYPDGQIARTQTIDAPTCYRRAKHSN